MREARINETGMDLVEGLKIEAMTEGSQIKGPNEEEIEIVRRS